MKVQVFFIKLGRQFFFSIFVCCVQELFGHNTLNYTRCILFAQLHCVFYQHIASFFIFLSIACKCLG
jgi:hypothetical protein